MLPDPDGNHHGGLVYYDEVPEEVPEEVLDESDHQEPLSDDAYSYSDSEVFHEFKPPYPPEDALDQWCDVDFLPSNYPTTYLPVLVECMDKLWDFSNVPESCYQGALSTTRKPSPSRGVDGHNSTPTTTALSNLYGIVDDFIIIA